MFTKEQLELFQTTEFPMILTGMQILQITNAILEAPTRLWANVLPIFNGEMVKFLAKQPKEEKEEELSPNQDKKWK